LTHEGRLLDRNLVHSMLNMIAQLNSHPEYPSVTYPAPLSDRSTTLHRQISVVNTPEDRFCTEIVANALKIASTGQHVLVVQLLKGGIRQGHDRVINLAQNLDWIRCNLIRNITTADLNDLELHNFQQLWKHVQSITRSGEYSLVILDDLSFAIELGLVTVEAATSFLTNLPDDVEIVLTGTNHHPALMEM
jgi:cob(I)alamin adenosyltransferase